MRRPFLAGSSSSRPRPRLRCRVHAVVFVVVVVVVPLSVRRKYVLVCDAWMFRVADNVPDRARVRRLRRPRSKNQNDDMYTRSRVGPLARGAGPSHDPLYIPHWNWRHESRSRSRSNIYAARMHYKYLSELCSIGERARLGDGVPSSVSR